MGPSFHKIFINSSNIYQSIQYYVKDLRNSSEEKSMDPDLTGPVVYWGKMLISVLRQKLLCRQIYLGSTGFFMAGYVGAFSVLIGAMNIWKRTIVCDVFQPDHRILHVQNNS